MSNLVTTKCSSSSGCLAPLCCSYLKPSKTDDSLNKDYKVQICIPDKTLISGAIPCAALSACAIEAAA